MDRRSFFRSATVGAGASVIAIVGTTHADEVETTSPAPRRTAVTVTIVPVSWEPHEVELVAPRGFVPKAVSCSERQVLLALLDDSDDPVLEVDGYAFEHGPLDLWRDVRGPLRCRVEHYSTLSWFPTVTVTVYGEIER